ncbi:hypothetical protein [Nonomuraea polychroma]|nr:hypothetical protein [Nonomuraea polychroma]
MTLVAPVALVTGAVAPTASASIRQNPWIYVSPETGPPGTEITVDGIGFLPNLLISISHPGLSGPDSIKAQEFGGIPAATFRVMESTEPGTITIQYRQAENIIATADFTVQRR